MRVHMLRVTRSAEVASCGDAPSFHWRTHRVFGGMVRVGGMAAFGHKQSISEIDEKTARGKSHPENSARFRP